MGGATGSGTVVVGVSTGAGAAGSSAGAAARLAAARSRSRRASRRARASSTAGSFARVGRAATELNRTWAGSVLAVRLGLASERRAGHQERRPEGKHRQRCRPRARHGQRPGERLVGNRHRSARFGGAPARIRKLVYLPIRFSCRTNSLRRVPAASLRSNLRSRTSRLALVVAIEPTGQPRPRQRTCIREPRGARTDRICTRAPRGSTTPAIRTTGNGRIRTSGVKGSPSGFNPATGALAGGPSAGGASVGALTVTVWNVVPDAPCSSVAVSVAV